MTTLVQAYIPLLELAETDLPERPAVPIPIHDRGFRVLVCEAHPNLDYDTQRHCCTDTTIHVWRDRNRGDHVVLRVRGDGRHTVQESGAPWYDRLSRLAGMWDATSTRGGDRR